MSRLEWGTNIEAVAFTEQNVPKANDPQKGTTIAKVKKMVIADPGLALEVEFTGLVSITPQLGITLTIGSYATIYFDINPEWRIIRSISFLPICYSFHF